MVLVFSGPPQVHHSAILTTIHHHCWTLNYSDSVHPPLNTVPGIQIRNLKQELCDHLTLLHRRVELWWQPPAGDSCRFYADSCSPRMHVIKLLATNCTFSKWSFSLQNFSGKIKEERDWSSTWQQMPLRLTILPTWPTSPYSDQSIKMHLPSKLASTTKTLLHWNLFRQVQF